MRPILTMMALLLTLFVATASYGIEIDGPTACKAGETVVLRVSDVKFDIDANARLGDIWKAVRQVQIQCGEEILGVEVRMKFVPDGVQLILEAEVTPKEDGEAVVLAIDRTDKALAVLPATIHVIKVGKGVPTPDPQPDPDPDPDPDPVEKGPRYLLFLHEKHPTGGSSAMKTAAEWKNLFTRIRQDEMKGGFKGHVIAVVDDDASEESYARFLNGKDPETGEPYRKNNDPTPTLVILDQKTGRILWHGHAPKGIAELKSLLAEHGG